MSHLPDKPTDAPRLPEDIDSPEVSEPSGSPKVSSAADALSGKPSNVSSSTDDLSDEELGLSKTKTGGIEKTQRIQNNRVTLFRPPSDRWNTKLLPGEEYGSQRRVA